MKEEYTIVMYQECGGKEMTTYYLDEEGLLTTLIDDCLWASKRKIFNIIEFYIIHQPKFCATSLICIIPRVSYDKDNTE